jgi:hypothetical protein
VGSVIETNIGAVGATFLRDMLAQTRAGIPQRLTTLASGITDLRLYRVWIRNTVNGVHLTP